MSRPDGWIKELELLALRFAHLGFGPDLSVMTVVELAGASTASLRGWQTLRNERRRQTVQRH